jgi:hypothetical protein
MLRHFVISVVLASAMASCCLAQEKKDPFEALKKGVQGRSDSLMSIFFEAWYKASDSVRKEPTTSLEKEAESIVELLLAQPKRTLPPFIVLSPKIEIYSDTHPGYIVDYLENMYPRKLFGSKTLFYSEKYIEATEPYLRGIGNPDGIYICKFTAMSCHMGGCGVSLEPVITSIRFSENDTVAYVQAAMREAGWDISLSKTNGKWKEIKRSMTWVE